MALDKSEVAMEPEEQEKWAWEEGRQGWARAVGSGGRGLGLKSPAGVEFPQISTSL
jgi:hypothetical protein